MPQPNPFDLPGRSVLGVADITADIPLLMRQAGRIVHTEPQYHFPLPMRVGYRWEARIELPEGNLVQTVRAFTRNGAFRGRQKAYVARLAEAKVARSGLRDKVWPLERDL